ncbi:MAG TPA: hypothetical protein DCO79_12295 [Spirochaeta sp.]|nr:hypothetical protein [Spirochaeta sp.]
MLETIINTGLIITLFAITAPFIFVLLVIRIVAGSNKRTKKKERSKQDESDDLNDIEKGLRDLDRRMDNLETLNGNKRDKER